MTNRKNRENAMRQLRSILYDKELQHRMAEQAKVEAGKKKIEWGSQIRSYVFDDRRVKDHRTNYQTSDVNGVMDGKIDGFIKSLFDGVFFTRIIKNKISKNYFWKVNRFVLTLLALNFKANYYG